MNDQPAPESQSPSTGSDLPTIESSGGREGRFRARDGAVIRYAWWHCDAAQPRGTLLFFNGRTEFIEKNIETVGELLARGFDVWTLDWRGQGLSQRALNNHHKGYINDYSQYLGDLKLFFRDHVDPNARGRLVLLAHSMGGHIALRLLHDAPDRFERAVLTSPLVDLYGDNLIVRAAVKVLTWFGRWPAFARAYIPGTGNYGPNSRRFEGNKLTSDKERFDLMHAQIDAHPALALGGPTAAWVRATRHSIVTLHQSGYAQAIRTPVLLVSAGKDRVVSNRAQKAISAQMPACRLEIIADAKHEILIERDELRQEFWRLFDDFVLSDDAEESSHTSQRDAG